MKSLLFAIVIGIAVLLAGCASGGLPREDGRAAPARAYYAEGQALEGSGQLVEAARMYKLALTLTTKDDEIAQALERNETERKRLAEERYQKGEQDYASGRFKDSKVAYLAALRLWPDHAATIPAR